MLEGCVGDLDDILCQSASASECECTEQLESIAPKEILVLLIMCPQKAIERLFFS